MTYTWWTQATLDALLAEDVPYGDLTTEALALSQAPARLTMAMRSESTLCGVEVAQALFRTAGGTADILRATGARVPAGETILMAQGEAGAIFKAWKVAQTLVEYLSGIATLTADIIAAARKVAPDVAVVTTRKTLPGAKAQMIAAIRAGGAFPHRLGLSETLLLFPEHQAFLTDAAAGVALLRRAAPEKKVVVEVKTPEEVEKVLPAHPDVLQCEKMTPDEIRVVAALVAARAPATKVAAAGGVNLQNAAAYAAAGAHVLVTSAPYWAKPADVKVVITPA
ncbi:ModD protein [Xanthobacter dioxanivorans]|uniref:Putative pyrophosphorylase ModD n=1 Tax=Xanthobacter dioxanivorans TaxID=2528964 RepID=A0A974PQF2_9HYPH|nr:ModD protein [Xanthobacter dioxanivorans]QRG07551.1 ModD protein [Xanthobacter dioxanivorans]